jgi:AmiR/NasT family two-component response regulator
MLITNYNNKKILKEAKEAGIEKVICKPFSAESLVSYILVIRAIL